MPRSKRIKRSVWDRTKTRPRKWSAHMFNSDAPASGHRRVHQDDSRVKRLTFADVSHNYEVL